MPSVTRNAQHIHQLLAPLGSDMLGKLSFVLFGQALDLGQHLFTIRGQLQRVPSRIAAGSTPADPFAPFQLVQQAGKPRPFDAERLPDRRLRAARIGFDNEQHGILRRTHFHRRQRLDEVLEYPDLQSAQKKSEVMVELAQA